MFRKTRKTSAKIAGTLIVFGLFGVSVSETGSAAPAGSRLIMRKDFRNAKPLKWKSVSSTDYALLGRPNDLFTTSNEYITAEEQMKDPQGSAKRLSGLKGSTDTQATLIRYEDGAVSLSVPPPLAEQVDPKIEFDVSSLDEAASDAQKISEVLASGHGWTKTAGGLLSSVIGSDNRTRATPTNYYPRNAIGQLTLGDGTVCSAVLYSSNRVVTAAHCLYNNGWKGFPNWKFRPGRDGGTIPTECGVTGGFILGGYPSNNSIQNDFGGVKLDCNISGSVGNGYYPQVALAIPPAQSFIDGLYVVGYPVNAQGQYVVGQQWEDVGRVVYDNSFLKSTNTDQTGGQSGGLWAVPCNYYGYYYCEIGPVEGGSIFLNNPLNAAHQLTPSDLANLANF